MIRPVATLAALALCLSAGAAHAGEREEYDWAGFQSNRSMSLLLDLTYQRGEATGGSTYSRFAPQLTFSASELGEDGRSSSGHPFGMQFTGALGWRTGEKTLSGPTIPSSAIPVPLFMDLGLVALSRILGGEGHALVAFIGPDLSFGGPEWSGGMFRLALTCGARYGLTVAGLDVIAELKVQPFELRDDPVYDLTEDGVLPETPKAFDRIDYLGTLFVRPDHEGPLFGARVGLTPMRARGFFGRQWTFSLVGGI